MLTRADALLAIGNVSAARLLYERAAAAGDAAAAAHAGRTYDPRVLAELGTVGLRPDAEAAAGWYRRAMSLGHREAVQWLEVLERAGR
jgi:TPR repeat protein